MVPTQNARLEDRLPRAPVRAAEPVRERRRRHARRQGLYIRAGLVVALVGVLIALVAANTSPVRIDWVVGTTDSPLVWIVFVSAVIGGLVASIGGALLRRRTRRAPDAAAPRRDVTGPAR